MLRKTGIAIALFVLSGLTACGPRPLYKLSGHGAIARYVGPPCENGACRGWETLDNNPNTVSIVANASGLFQRRRDGSIHSYVGTPCQSGACPGWLRIDGNPLSIAVAASGQQLYQLHRDGSVWHYRLPPCSTGSCPRWEMIGNGFAEGTLASFDGRLYMLDRERRMWRWTGARCRDGSCPPWDLLDRNPDTVQIAAVGEDVYQLRSNGTVWRWWPHVTCSLETICRWRKVGHERAISAIAVAGGRLFYLMPFGGGIWRFNGVDCSPTACTGWQAIDTNPATTSLASDGRALYQMRTEPAAESVSVWIYIGGGGCDNRGECPGWVMLDNDPETIAIRGSAP